MPPFLDLRQEVAAMFEPEGWDIEPASEVKAIGSDATELQFGVRNGDHRARGHAMVRFCSQLAAYGLVLVAAARDENVEARFADARRATCLPAPR